MKRFLFLTFMVVFAANSVSLAAVMPCVSTDAKVSDVAASGEMAMPSCHDKIDSAADDSSPYAPHCEDVCFCQHALLSPAAVMSDFVLIPTDFYSETQIFVSDRFSVSTSYFPPFRPPASLI